MIRKTKTTATHQVSLSIGDTKYVQGYKQITTRKLRDGKPFGPLHTKNYPTAKAALLAFIAM